MLNRVHVCELVAWTLVPETGTLLTVRGADVIKLEHRLTRDPQRGLNGRQYASAGKPVRLDETPLSQKCARGRGKHTAALVAELGCGEEGIINCEVKSVVL
ncbi:hypothetical protein [Mycobacterium paraseoulense]|uniref:hypothetical protein n=1 Tax=Mycobacterium paraseoulense TaxID=590652 RepID=UPI00114E83B8|nr:hypothetical protein [Mycobacterium paraseoulense]MCV7393977.1 hypothetical protein [Mycobacterium paraseoulense]